MSLYMLRICCKLPPNPESLKYSVSRLPAVIKEDCKKKIFCPYEGSAYYDDAMKLGTHFTMDLRRLVNLYLSNGSRFQMW